MGHLSVLNFTLTAGEALAANTLVNINSSGQVTTASAGGAVRGVVLYDYDSGATDVVVEFAGVFEVKAGAAVVAGVELASDATGRAVTAATGNLPAGFAIEAASAADELITVVITGGGAVGVA